MGQKNSKAASDAAPDKSIFPIGGGHTGDGAIPERTPPTAALEGKEGTNMATPISSGAGPSGEIQPEATHDPAVTHTAPEEVVPKAAPVSSGAKPSKEIHPEATHATEVNRAAPGDVAQAATPISREADHSKEIQSEAPTGTVAKHDIMDNPIFDSDSNDEPLQTTKDVSDVHSEPAASKAPLEVSSGKGLHSAPSSEGPVAPPNTPAVPKSTASTRSLGKDTHGEDSALASPGGSPVAPVAHSNRQGTTGSLLEDKDKVAAGGCFACFAGSKGDKANKAEAEKTGIADPAITEAARTGAPVAPVAAAVGGGEWHQADPAPIEELTPKDAKAGGVRFDDRDPFVKPGEETNPELAAVPTPSADRELGAEETALKDPKAGGVRFEDEPAVKPEEATHPVPTLSDHREPRLELPVEEPPASVQGTPEAATPAPAPMYASYDTPQPGEVVRRDYSSTQQSESTQTRTTTSGLPAAAVAVPVAAAARFAVGGGGKDKDHATSESLEKPAVEAAPMAAGPGTPAMQDGKSVRAEDTPVKAADNEQAGLHDGSRIPSTDITEMPGIGSSLPSTPTREAGSVATGGDEEATPEKQQLTPTASGSHQGLMTPLTKLQTAHEDFDDSVDVPSDKGYAGKGLGTPHSSLDMAGGQYSPLETEELHSKLETLSPDPEEEEEEELHTAGRDVDYESATPERHGAASEPAGSTAATAGSTASTAEPALATDGSASATAGSSAAAAGHSGAHTAEVAVGSALAAGAAAGAANAAFANKELSKKDMLAASKSSKKLNKEAEASAKAERATQVAALKQREKEDRANSKKKMAEEKSFKKEQREKQKQEMSQKALNVEGQGEGEAADGQKKAAASKSSRGFLGLFGFKPAAAASGTTTAAAGTTAAAAVPTATASSGPGLGAVAGIGVAAGMAGGALGGLLVSRGGKGGKGEESDDKPDEKPGREGETLVALPAEVDTGPSSSSFAPASAAGFGTGEIAAESSRGATAGLDVPPSSGGVAVHFDEPYTDSKVLDTDYPAAEPGAIEGPLTPAASEAGKGGEGLAEKPKKLKSRRNIDYSAIQMERAKAAASSAKLREGYNPATGLYEPGAQTGRVAPGAYSPMRTSHPVLQQSAMQARQASLKRRQSQDLGPVPARQTTRTSSWANSKAAAPAGRGIDRAEVSMNKRDYRPMSSTFG